MAKIIDYETLKNNVQTWLAYDDIEDVYDAFLGLAESRIRRDIRIREMEAQVDFGFDSNSSYTLPTGFLQIIDLYETGVGGGVLEYLPPQKFYSLYLSRGGSGQPAYYTIIGDEVRCSPLSGSPEAWEASKEYAVGDLVKSTATGQENNIFKCTTAGTSTSGACPLTAPDAGIGDGTVVWDFSSTDRAYRLNYFKEFNALDPVTYTTNTLLTLAPDVYLYGVLFEAQPYLVDQAREEEFDALYRRAIDGLHASDTRARHRPRGRAFAEGVTPDGAFRI